MRVSGLVVAAGIVATCVAVSWASERTPTRPAARAYGTARIYLTAQNTENRVTEQPAVPFAELLQPEESFPTIILDASKTSQTVEGFGGALTDASAETYYKMSPEKRREIITALFDPRVGNAFTLCRTNINSCDFSSDIYAYDETPGDVKLEHFTIEHDRWYKIPFIKEASAAGGGHIDLLASPWSTAGFCTRNTGRPGRIILCGLSGSSRRRACPSGD
jgi:glucosylceramidase